MSECSGFDGISFIGYRVSASWKYETCVVDLNLPVTETKLRTEITPQSPEFLLVRSSKLIIDPFLDVLNAISGCFFEFGEDVRSFSGSEVLKAKSIGWSFPKIKSH